MIENSGALCAGKLEAHPVTELVIRFGLEKSRPVLLLEEQ